MKITKSESKQRCIDNETAIATLESLLKEHGITRKQEPKLKQLDQSAFDHRFVTDHFKYAALNGNGQSIFFSDKPKYNLELGVWYSTAGSTMPMLKGYDTSNWQNSLIERDKVELTGSDLCRAMLGNGFEYVMCLVGDECEESASNSEVVRVICSRGADYFDDTTEDMWYFAIPVNNQGEPLTQSDVGL